MIEAINNTHGDGTIVKCCSLHKSRVIKVNDKTSFAFRVLWQPIDEYVLDAHVVVDNTLLVHRSVTLNCDQPTSLTRKISYLPCSASLVAPTSSRSDFA